MKSEKEKLHTGELYLPGDEEIMREQLEYQDLLCEYNLTKPSEGEKRTMLLKKMLGDCGEGVYVEAPFYANWGGHNCHFGDMVYANYHLTCVDDTHIYVGDYTMFGPNVTIATAGHPILPELRKKQYQYNMPVHIGSNCWIGAGVIIMPGVIKSEWMKAFSRASFKNGVNRCLMRMHLLMIHQRSLYTQRIKMMQGTALTKHMMA